MIKDTLLNCRLILLIDKSGSMAIKDCPNNTSRWQHTEKEVTAFLAEVLQHKKEEIFMSFFSGGFEFEEVHDEANLPVFFSKYSTGGMSDTGKVLAHVLETEYSEERPVIICIVTDGAPSEEQELIDVISKFPEDRLNFAIVFFQVGKDEAAKKFLWNLGEIFSDRNLLTIKTVDDMADTTIKDVLLAHFDSKPLDPPVENSTESLTE